MTKKDITLSFDYYTRTKDIILKSILFLNSSQKPFIKSFFPFYIDNTHYFFSCLENTLLYKELNQAKIKHTLFNKISNINKNILEIYKDIKFISLLITIQDKIIFDRNVLFLFFDIIIILIIIKVKYDHEREEKRREEKRENYIPGKRRK